MEPQLRKLPVDLEEIVLQASTHEGHSDAEYDVYAYVDTHTGAVHVLAVDAFRYLDGDLEADELTEWAEGDVPIATAIHEDSVRRFVEIERADPSEDFATMEEFAVACQEARVRDALLNALRGRRPFRAFRDTIHSWPDVREAWFSFQTLEQRRRVRDWLETLGVNAIDASLHKPGLLPPR